MGKFRFLRTRDNVYYMVPSHHAQMLEILSSTTYKECEITCDEIRRMTEFKEEVDVDHDEWLKNIGNVLFVDEDKDEQQNVETERKIERRKKTQEFVNDIIGDVFGKVTYESTEADRGRGRGRGRVPARRGGAAGGRVINDFLNVEESKSLSNVVHGIFNDNKITTIARTDKKRSVFVDVGYGISRILIYLAGVNAIDVIYTNSKKINVDITLTSVPDFVISMREVFFRVPTNVIEEGALFGTWYYKAMEEKRAMEEFISDANTNFIIKETAKLLWETPTSEFINTILSDFGNDAESITKTMLHGKDFNTIKKLFIEDKFNKDWSEFESMSSLELTQEAYRLKLGHHFKYFINMIKGDGKYSNNYFLDTHEVNHGNVPVLMNYAKLVNRYDSSDNWLSGDLFEDYTNICRMVVKYSYTNITPFAKLLGIKDFVNIAESFDATLDRDIGEFKKSMTAGLCIYILFMTPFLTNFVHLSNESLNLIRSSTYREIIFGKGADSSFKSVFNGITRVGDFFTMGAVVLTCHSELVLKSQILDDKHYDNDSNFSYSSLEWYYASASVQLYATSIFRTYVNGIKTDYDDKLKELSGLALAMLFVVSAIDVPTDINAFDLIGVAPFASLAWVMYSFISRGIRITRNIANKIHK